MTGHVFISHSEKDKTFAEMLLNALESRDLKCWIAPRNIPPGGSYADAILTAIEECGCFILIFTEHSNSSGHVLREVERALKFNKNIVPIRFDESAPSRSLDYLLATVQWVSVDTRSAKVEVQRAAQQIAASLQPATEHSLAAAPAAPVVHEKSAERPTARNKPVRRALVVTLFLFVLAIAAAALLFSLFLSRRSLPVELVQASPAPAIQIPAPPQPTPSPEITPKAELTGGPEETLERYFACFGERDAAAAYRLLSNKFRARLSFKAFSQTFSSTRSIRLLEHDRPLNNENAATILVLFEEEDADHHRVQWRGPVGLVRESAGWRIDTMKDLKRLSAASSAQTKLPAAASAPARTPEQTWDRPHIYLEMASKSQTKTAQDLKGRLTGSGYVVVAVEEASGNVDIPTETSELRYFTPGDSAEAQRIAHEIEPFLGTSGVVAYIPEGMPYVSHARQYEIWFSSRLP